MAIVEDKKIGSGTAGDGTTTPSFVTNQTVAAGAFIVVTIGWFTQGTLNSVSGGGLAWTVDKTGFPGTPSNVVTAIASAQAPAGLPSGTTITFTTSVNTSGPTQGGVSFTGVKSSGTVVDGTPVGSVGVSPAAAGWTTGNATLAAGSVLVGTSWAETSIATSTPTAPCVEVYDTSGGGGWGATTCYRIESGAGAVAVAGTWNGNQQSGTVGVAYLVGAVTPDTGLAWITA